MATVSSGKRFESRAEMLAIEAPLDRPFIEVWHSRDRGFGVRIMRVSKSGEAVRSYLARYKTQDGKDRKEVLGRIDELNYDDARFAAINRVRVARDRRKDPQAAPSLTLKQAYDGYIKERTLSPQSVHGYGKRLSLVDGYLKHLQQGGRVALPVDQMPASLMREQQWDECFDYIAARSGQASAKSMARLLHAVYERLVALKQVQSNPCSVLKRRGIYTRAVNARRPIPRASLPKVWHWLQNSTHPAVRDYMLLGLLTGLRESVLGALEWENIDIENKRLKVPPEARGNKRKVLVWMPLSDWLMDNIIEPRFNSLAMSNEKRWLLPSPKRAGMPLRDVRGSFDALYKATGVQVSDHDLRSTFAGLAESVMGSTKAAAQMLTHSSSSMTAGTPAHTGGYITVEPDDMRMGFNRVATALVWYATHKAGERPPVRSLADWDDITLTA
jgi:integrase